MLNFGYEKGKYWIVFSKKKSEESDKTILYNIMIRTQK
jgi:hypothetical protein